MESKLNNFPSTFKYTYSSTSKKSSPSLTSTATSAAASLSITAAVAAAAVTSTLSKSLIDQRFDISSSSKRNREFIPGLSSHKDSYTAETASSLSYTSSSSGVIAPGISFSKSFSSRQPRVDFRQPFFNNQPYCLPNPKRCISVSCADTNCKPPEVDEDDISFEDDEDEKSIASSTTTAAGEEDTSSVEDLEDAFKEELVISNNISKHKKIKTESTKRDIRQKWDADSLKSFSQGKL
jgi:hypothetical protein